MDILKPEVQHPERFMNIHFFNPAPCIPGAELVASDETVARSGTCSRAQICRAVSYEIP